MNDSQLERQLGELFEGRLTGEALEKFQHELRTNPEARLAYRDHARLHNALQVRAEGTDPLQIIPMDRVVERRRQRTLRRAGILAAVIVVLGAILMTFHCVRTPPPALTFATSPGTTVSLSRVTGAEPSNTSALEPGSRLEVLNGTVELTFASGVRGILRGPADLTLHREDLLYLARGTGWFEVPKEAVGFKVNTPDLNLTDLGTEFGVISRPDFLDEVHVFEGRVEVVNRYGLKMQETITAGKARMAGPAGRWREIPLRRDRFLSTLPTIGQPWLGEAVFHDDFDRDSSADYVCRNYYETGKETDLFSIDAPPGEGVLQINAQGKVGAQVVHRSAKLEVGQSFCVDWLTPAQSGYSISQVLTDSTEGLRYCVRLRVNDGAYVVDFERGHEGKVTWFNRSAYTAPETFWVKRLSATEFVWSRSTPNLDLIKIAEITFDSDPGPLLAGVQSWATTARFDNFAILPAKR